MVEISWIKDYKYVLRKLFWATILFFLWLILWVKPVGEPNAVVETIYLPLESSSGDNSSQVSSGSYHYSPSDIFWNELGFDKERAFKEKCLEKSDFCDKVFYSGAISIEEKNQTLDDYLDILSFLNVGLIKWKQPSEALKILLINGMEGKRRWGATWEKITINLSSLFELQEFYKVLVHEFGHIVDLGALQGLSLSKNGNFTEFGRVVFAIDDPSLEYYRYSRQSEAIRKNNAQRKDFCSGYGMTNPFEDFAECFNLYLTNHQLFKEIGKSNPTLNQKYNYFANLFLWSYLFSGDQELYSLHWRPWDTTKI